MKLVLILFVFLMPYQQTGQKLTTVILIRHAEKLANGSKNSELSEAGKKRALLFADIMAKTKVDAVYSTDFKRTENTVVPLAKAQNLSVLKYEGGNLKEIDDLLSKWKGGTIVICGHSNTTPSIVNHLTGNKDEYKSFEDIDYGNLIIVTLADKGAAKIIWLRY